MASGLLYQETNMSQKLFFQVAINLGFMGLFVALLALWIPQSTTHFFGPLAWLPAITLATSFVTVSLAGIALSQLSWRGNIAVLQSKLVKSRVRTIGLVVVLVFTTLMLLIKSNEFGTPPPLFEEGGGYSRAFAIATFSVLFAWATLITSIMVFVELNAPFVQDDNRALPK